MTSLPTSPYVLLDDSKTLNRGDAGLLFKNPIDIIEITRFDMVLDALARIENAKNKGYYLAGWISYECGYSLHPTLKNLKCPISEEPLIWLGIFNAPEKLSSNDLEAMLNPSHLNGKTSSFTFGPEATESEAEFGSAFNKIMNYIAAGDVYQVNHTFRLNLKYPGDALALYASIRKAQPVPFGAFINTGQWSVLSASPELFIQRIGNQLQSRPMKGTAKPGQTISDVRINSAALKADKKNRAENLMITDLIRNDFSRVCRPGSVKVSKLFEVEHFSKVLQMSSEVQGTLNPKTPFTEIFSCLFPCGSITGAPKIRAMEIIQETENEPRGLYTGALGFLTPKGDFTFSVPIRTIVMNKSGKGHMAIGSGIVANSTLKNEYEECLLKSHFLKSTPKKFALIETFLWTPKEGFQYLEDHLRRLKQSSLYFDYAFSLNEIKNQLKFIDKSLKGNGTHKIRLTINQWGKVSIQAQPFKPMSKTTTVNIIMSQDRVNKDNTWLFHKTTNRNFYDVALKAAREKHDFELYDVVFRNTEGEITEGTFNTIFISKGKSTLETPFIEAGLLPGILRSKMIESGKAKETSLTIDDLKNADNIYLGNSVRGLIKVKLLD